MPVVTVMRLTAAFFFGALSPGAAVGATALFFALPAVLGAFVSATCFIARWQWKR